MKTAGNLFVIPKELIRSDDIKDRPLPLMTDMRSTGRGTVMYASTQPTHRVAGAEAVDIPARRKDRPPGFSDATIVFPGLLYAIDAGALKTHVGCLTPDEQRAILDKVPTGIGCGQGSVARADGTLAPGLRGMVMRFTDAWTREVLWQYAIVLTRAPYVVQPHAFHLMVPLLINPRRVEAPNVELVEAAWHQRVPMMDQPVRRVVASVRAASCVKLDRLQGAVPGAVCTTAEAEQIEVGLLAWLGCSSTPVAVATPPDPGSARTTAT